MAKQLDCHKYKQAFSSRLDDKAFTRGRIDHFAIKNANEQPNVTPSTTEKWNIFQRVTYDIDLWTSPLRSQM